MGYTHNWYRPQTITPATFHAITEDFQHVLPALEVAGSPIANADGVEEPEFTAEYIHFNGVRFCGHGKNPQIRLPWPAAQAGGIGDNAAITSGTLPYRTCNGECTYESVWFERCVQDEYRHDNGLCGGFCKTAFRPYDLAVTVFLLIVKHRLGNEFHIDTDGEAKQWEDAQRLCLAGLGYSLSYEEVTA